jgi:streptogramin lyase
MWFTANAVTFRGLRASVFGKVNPTTGAVSEFPIPASSGAALPGTPILGSDGNIWTTLGNSNDVARVTTH